MARRVEAVQLGAVVGLVIGACFVKPDPPSGADPDGGAASDGRSVTDGPPACPLRDNFNSDVEPVCGTWGSNVGSGNHVAGRLQGRLGFYATDGSGGTAACQSTVEVPFTSVVVQILTIVDADDAHTGVMLTFDDGQTFTLDIAADAGASATVSATNGNGAVPTPLGNYSGNTLQYVRFHKEGPSQIDLSYSSDGSSWQPPEMFMSPSTLGRVKVRLYTEFGPNVTSFRQATFDNLDGCAP